MKQNYNAHAQAISDVVLNQSVIDLARPFEFIYIESLLLIPLDTFGLSELFNPPISSQITPFPPMAIPTEFCTFIVKT